MKLPFKLYSGYAPKYIKTIKGEPVKLIFGYTIEGADGKMRSRFTSYTTLDNTNKPIEKMGSFHDALNIEREICDLQKYAEEYKELRKEEMWREEYGDLPEVDES